MCVCVCVCVCACVCVCLEIESDKRDYKAQKEDVDEDGKSAGEKNVYIDNVPREEAREERERERVKERD